MISRRRFITDFVIALTPLGATASALEYKAWQVIAGFDENLQPLGLGARGVRERQRRAGIAEAEWSQRPDQLDSDTARE